MDLLPSELRDVAVLRRIIFASVYLPKDVPNYWSVLTQFATQECQLGSLQTESVKVAVENLHVINEKAFVSDKQLTNEIHALCTTSSTPHQIGIVLVSSHSKCQLCEGNLLVRGDRPSHITVYTETYGTVIGTHYHKHCQNHNKGCSFRQYYGYSSRGSQSITYYDSDWEDNMYFVSSSETAFELHMLQKFDAELLHAHVSYKQKAQIYNHSNGYPVPPKTCSTLDKDQIPPRSVKSCLCAYDKQKIYHAAEWL